MRGLAAGASMALALAPACVAHAAQIDMGKLTCKGFLQAMPKDPGGANLMWMSGYFAGKAGETIFDTERHMKASRQLGYVCRNNPDALFIDVYRRALEDNSGRL